MSDDWSLDQLAKSAFFHRKLHEWRLLEVAVQLEQVSGEALEWEALGISPTAWKRVIHRGIRPVVVFAHPRVLQDVVGAVAYYRMLAMVSQKSMKNLGLNIDAYERDKPLTDGTLVYRLAVHLNGLISRLIEADSDLNPREFDLWRGMAAGTQAQGAWQNQKGHAAEQTVLELIYQHLRDQGLDAGTMPLALPDERRLVVASDPDLAIWYGETLQIAIEVKGGIDAAGALERLGAAIKSLTHLRSQYPAVVTVLIMHGGTFTERAIADSGINPMIDHLFNLGHLLEDGTTQRTFFNILGI